MTREEAIDIFEHNWTRLENHDYTEEELNEAFDMAIKALEQEPKTGHWIKVVTEVSDLGNETWHYECSKCGACSFASGDDRFCHHCGAEMKEGDA